MSEELKAIRERHEADRKVPGDRTTMHAQAHLDRALLLSLLAASEARLSGPFTVEKFSIEDDWTTEIHADGARIASGYPSGNPQTPNGSGAKIRELVDRANRCAAAEARAEAAEARVGELEEALKPLAPTPEVIHAIRECLDTDQFFLTGDGWEIGPVTAGDLRRLSTLKGAPDGR